MATITHRPSDRRPPAGPRTDGFDVELTDHGLGPNTPQQLGSRLWGPMFAMALLGFVGGLVAAFVRSATIAGSPGEAVTIAQLHHVQAALTFIGMLGVLSAIVFAIARILGRFRAGGGEVQEAASGTVQTLRMPMTARGMMALMGLGMLLIIVPVVLHLVVASSIEPTEGSLLAQEQWFVALEGARRLGVVAYLLGIALGLATIVRVLRFQSVRVLELVDEAVG